MNFKVGTRISKDFEEYWDGMSVFCKKGKFWKGTRMLRFGSV